MMRHPFSFFTFDGPPIAVMRVCHHRSRTFLTIVRSLAMQSLLGPAKLEGLLKSPSDVIAQHDLEPASPFANMNAVASFWKGERRVFDKLFQHKLQLRSLMSGLHGLHIACRVRAGQL